MTCTTKCCARLIEVSGGVLTQPHSGQGCPTCSDKAQRQKGKVGSIALDAATFFNELKSLFDMGLPRSAYDGPQSRTS